MPFYVSDNEKWIGRVIIPYIFREKIVYWQARSMDETITPRYKNPSIDKENLFFNMDEIYRYTDEPLFVTEGPLDARSIGKNGVALLGSTLSEFRERELNKIAARRKIIFVIDKNLNGYKLGQKVLKHNWSITCFPDNVDDSNDALQSYGHLWLINYITTTAVNGFQGRTLLEVRCK
jgi:DNA primase